VRAHKIARQGFRITEADNGRTGDLEQHAAKKG
jgi:hypothetical protein